MKVTLTLNQSNGIINKIKTMLWMDIKSKGRVPDMAVKVNMGDAFLNQSAATSSARSKLEELHAQVLLQEQLYQVLYNLRKTVVSQNCLCGINAVLSDLSCLNDIKGLYMDIKNNRDGSYHDYVDQDFLFTLETATLPAVDGLIDSNREVAVFSSSALLEKVTSLDIQITTLERKRDELNNNTKITVDMPDNVATLLALN